VTAYPLVTGATGFAGAHLLEHLLRSHDRVHAWSHAGGRHGAGTSDARVAWRAVDLLNADAVRAALREARPSAIYHCAGIADVHASWHNPTLPLRVNVIGTHILLDAAAAEGLTGPLVIASSALVYRPSSHAIAEDDPVGPTTPYGVSKLAQEMLAANSLMPVVVARAFNHAGPRQEESFVTSAFARQLAEIEAGVSDPVIRVGNLESRRDITDVRDVVRAYARLAERGRAGRVYNVCSGRAHRVRDLLDVLLSCGRVPVRVETDASRLRPSDNPVVLGSRSRITDETGWEPAIPIEQTLGDLLNYWRATVPLRAAGRP
jgi:GDP-4-dehydro-6-deoxy-D-mannose reductase